MVCGNLPASRQGSTQSESAHGRYADADGDAGRVASGGGSGGLRGELTGLCSARNGDYRILVTIDESTNLVWIHRIQHRAHVYRP